MLTVCVSLGRGRVRSGRVRQGRSRRDQGAQTQTK